VLDIQLVGEIVPASSYVGNSFVVFTVQDGTVYTLVSLEASVADNFSVNVTGSGNYDSDSGCSDAEDATGWTPTVKNFGNTMDSFSITFDTADAAGAGWTVDGATSDNTGMLNPKFEHNEADGTGMFTMNVGLHIPAGLPAGTMHGFTMTVISDTDSSVTQTQSFSATVTQCYGLTMTVDKAADSANPGNSADFTISVTNGGNGDDTVSLATMGASEWSPTLAESELTIASGATSTTLLSITVPSDASANAASGSVMAHAYSEGCGDDTTDCGYAYDVSVSVTANQVYGLTAGYYSNETDVVKDTVSVQETMTVQMKFTVTNDGNGNDEIVLSLANAPAWVTLGQTEALAGPGQTMTLTVDVGPAGAVGDYTFQVTATSADGTTSSTTEDLTVTVTEKVDDSGGPATEKVEEDDSPGFGIITAIAAIGAVLLIRRRL
jgi:PGF-CTERM protein